MKLLKMKQKDPKIFYLIKIENPRTPKEDFILSKLEERGNFLTKKIYYLLNTMIFVIILKIFLNQFLNF